MLIGKKVSSFVKTALFCATLGPVMGSACVDGNTVERTIDRNYSSQISPVAFPVARHLGLGDSCYGRRLITIKMWASTSGGAGLATLLVNGRPVGVTQKLDSEVKLYEFPLDLDYNYMGVHLNMATMEIRLAGDFYVSKIAANLDYPEGTDDVLQDPWANYGVLLGQSPNINQDLLSSVFEINQVENPFNMLVFVARNASIEVERAVVHFADGTHKVYGRTLIPEGEARRIDNEDCKLITKVVIKAQTAQNCDCSTGHLELRGVLPETSDFAAQAL